VVLLELWGGIKKAVEEMRLHKQEKLKLRTAQELLNNF